MRTRESLGLTAAVLLLGGAAALAYYFAVTARRDAEAARAREEMIAAVDRERAALQPVALAANTFLVTLGGDDGVPRQTALTTPAFQARHQATGGVLRIPRRDGEVFGAPSHDAPSYSDRWTGSLDGGMLTCRGDVFCDGVVKRSYTVTLLRDRATGRWLVDEFSLAE